MAEQNNWEKLTDDNDYEILTNEPHAIRRIKDGYIPSISIQSRGYQRIALDSIQFIPNPNILPEIVHKNHIQIDNRLENLRWVTSSDNMKNLSSHTISYEYFDELPIDSQRLDMYSGHELEGYSFDQDFNVYYHNGLRYRKLNVGLSKNQYQFVKAYDINNK